MRFFLAFTFLCIALGIGYALEFDDALDTFDQLVDNTARQTNQDLEVIIPVFGIAFTASLLNNLFFRNGIALPTPAPAATTTTPPPPPPPTTAPPASTTAPPASTTAPPASTTAPPASTTAPPASTTAAPVSTTAGTTGTKDQYCAITSDHTMCKWEGPSTACAAKITPIVMTDVQKQSIVDKHNELRRKVAKGQQPDQPGATNMKEMVWNEEIAMIAQRFADQCMDICPVQQGGSAPASICHEENLVPAPPPNTNLKLRNKLDGTSVGQNVAGSTATSGSALVLSVADSLTKAVQDWYNEVDGIYDPTTLTDCRDVKFDSANISPFVSTRCHGHYTQVVWADSEEVGCGVVRFDENGNTETIVICNYAPGGNVAGSDMYKIGTAGSACPGGYTDNDGLCSKNKRKRNNQRKKNKKNRRRNKNKKYN